MPRSWTDSLPVHDQKWVSRAMFVANAKGKAIRVRWFALNLEDKKKVEYQPRFKDHLTQGRFKTSKKSSTTAGMDSVRR